MTDDLVQAPSTTALDPLPVIRPPVSLRVITIEKKVDRPVVRTVERVVERVVALPPAQARNRRVSAPPAPPARTVARGLSSSDDCKGDPLCGLSDLKQ